MIRKLKMILKIDEAALGKLRHLILLRESLFSIQSFVYFISFIKQLWFRIIKNLIFKIKKMTLQLITPIINHNSIRIYGTSWDCFSFDLRYYIQIDCIFCIIYTKNIRDIWHEWKFTSDIFVCFLPAIILLYMCV